jgi:hypothetical protein
MMFAVNFPNSITNFLLKSKGGEIGPYTALALQAVQANRAKKQFRTLQDVFDIHRPRSILDIGCGLGMASMMVAKYYQCEYLGLLDGDGTGELFSDYRAGAPAWNDVRLAGEMARANLPDECQVETFVAGRDEPDISVDAVVSFKSWGTHYPIATYLEMVVNITTQDSIVITDLLPDDESFRRTQSDQIQEAGFKLIDHHERRHVFMRL